MQVTVSGTFAANDYYTVSNNFPTANVKSALNVTTSESAGNKGAAAVVTPSGMLVVQSGANALTDLQIFITGIYLGGVFNNPYYVNIRTLLRKAVVVC